MNPIHFGSHDKRLFGVYHPPKAQVYRNECVLLCYPAFGEYERAHWAFRRLALLLSMAGFHVLRFDYFGTGDSAGHGEEGDLSIWINDIITAFDELRDISGAKKISIVGLRLGATLAAAASMGGISVNHLVLWDPVIIGKNYIQKLESIQSDLNAVFKWSPNENDQGELLGFPFPSALRMGIDKINLYGSPVFKSQRAYLFVSEKRPEYLAFLEKLAADGAPMDYHLVQDAGSWDKAEMIHEALLANDMLRAIKDVLIKI